MDNKMYIMAKNKKKKLERIHFVLQIKAYFTLLSQEYEKKRDREYVIGLSRYKDMYTKL